MPLQRIECGEERTVFCGNKQGSRALAMEWERAWSNRVAPHPLIGQLTNDGFSVRWSIVDAVVEGDCARLGARC